MLYTTVEEAHQKLLNTVVLYDKLPYYIDDIQPGDDGKILLEIVFCGDKTKKCGRYLDDPKFEIQNLGCRLGYVNYRTNNYIDSIWTFRTGIRKAQQTQGISRHNLMCSALHGCYETGIPEGYCLEFNSLIWNLGFTPTIKGEFPSPTESIDTLKQSISNVSMAFDRNFAIYKPRIGPLYLQYKNKPIGFCEQQDRFKIHEDYNYLNESLESIPQFKFA